jgi:Omptin family
MRRFRGALLTAAVLLGALPVAAPAAADPFFLSRRTAPPTYTYELGGRYWYGLGKTAKDLYDPTGAYMVSRLTYGKLQTHSFELFGRFDHSSHLFLKGYVGAGFMARGNLNDEDFPPTISPYSSTDSDQRQGRLFYASLDGGFDIIRGGDFRVGAFTGYHFLSEKLNAYGCTELASNSAVCAGSIASSVKVITQDNNWHSWRLGIDAAFEPFERMKVGVDAAWLPYVWLDGADSHWLRIGTDFTGPIPENGTGNGYQIDAVISYNLTPTSSIGIGGRYWHMEADGDTHFEGHTIGSSASPQPVRWKTDHYGMFVQANFKFGPYLSGM